ncbi:MAG: MaoC family dehydratase [Litorimonas sp.]
MKTVKAADLQATVGTDLGVSDWITIEQDRVNQFADVTEDHQFIHVNPEMAKMTPFGGPVAHGFLTLSLLAKFAEQGALTIEGVKMGVNYGFEKVRFLAPVKVGKKVRGHFKLKAAEEKRPGQYLVTYEVSVEIDGEDKPALVADWLGMQFTG